MHMLSRKDLNSAEFQCPEALQRLSQPVERCKQMRKQQYTFKDLDLFVTVQILEDTPAVPSLGKLCEEHGYTYGWASGQNPQLTKQGKTTLCKTENFVPLVVPGLSSNSGTSSSSTSQPQHSSSSSSSPVLERSDGIAPGNWRDSPNTVNTNKKRDDRRESYDGLHIL